MRVSDNLVEKLLTATGNFSYEQLVGLREQEKSENRPLQDIVVSNNIMSEKELTKLYAKEIDVPFVEISPRDLPKEVLELISERTAKQSRAIAFEITEDGVILVAMEDPDDVPAIGLLQKQLDKPIRVHIATASNIQSILDLYEGDSVSVSTQIEKVVAIQEKEEEETVDKAEVAEDSPIAQTVNLIIDYGVKHSASDIHIEPRENFVLIRYRVDGILREVNKLPRKVLGALVSRIKILSNLKIDEHRAPQDGRFKISVNNHIYALRVSTLPIIDGEKVVMRILDESSRPATLEELGYWGQSLDAVQRAIVQPHGMVLVTGPTGSGKSTSLFSVLSMLNTPGVNISTVEDPIEYHVKGANQTQVNPVAGMTFASGLRALLRQDPNIIMVGEIRDGETADLGVQAALTGHLVFSTLHTNNAATCLPRLLDMNIEPFLIASTIRIIIGQRLVRRLCPDCRTSYTPEVSELQHIAKVFGIGANTPIGKLHELEKLALEGGVGAKNSNNANGSDVTVLSSNDTTISQLWRANDDGCETCNHTGYKGRMGIYEVLPNTDKVQQLIVTNSTSEKIEKQAIEDGMVTMQIDGLVKALRGQTTIEEILRVTAESS
ncbi:MAG: type pilus assembly protein PilB [Patescibacteria group bacterium]|nr:type II/IV secretion system protein [Candidatus Saccharibacteria bacterium]MDQ5963224.1 type pilus assembly protein PilB [Patescibacteria group bacterium]